MARTEITEGPALWKPGGAEVDSRLREGDRHLRLVYEEEKRRRRRSFLKKKKIKKKKLPEEEEEEEEAS